MMNLNRHARRACPGIVALVLLLTASAASAETLLMPERDYLMGANEVVWGVTTLPNTTSTYTINFGDGTSVGPTAVTDRSFIAVNKTYAASGTFTITLTVTPSVGPAEVATVDVQVFNGAIISPEDLRNLNKNRAIHNGFRYLWFSQANRTNFDTTHVTNWGGTTDSYAALVTLSLMNHGFTLPNDNSDPVGLLPKYLVRRGLNHVLNTLQQVTLSAQAAGDPCVNVSDAPAPCQGLQEDFDPGYSTAVAMLPLAASGALNRTVNAAEIPTPVSCGGALPAVGCVHGKTIGEVLQRGMNAIAFGQQEPTFPVGRGGWIYQFNSSQSDGSTIGWDMLALLDAAAAGTTIPAFVQSEFRDFALPHGLNNDGSFDYRADNNPAVNNSPNLAKAGIALQGLFFAGAAAGDPRVAQTTTYISDRWNSTVLGQTFHCSPNGTINKGCAYGMFNVFKGLKLYGVTTLPGVGRAAGPGAIPANDWHADLEDWLVANQQAALTTTGGHWGTAGNPLSFSCCGTNSGAISTAMAELILAPVALIQPDPTLFSTVGLGPATATNPVGTNHTVTATATSAGGGPVPGATVVFRVQSGPNAGDQGQDVTDSNGQAEFTYTGDGGPGTDTIQAFIGTLGSNVVSKTWVRACDADSDNDIDSADLAAIRAANGQAESGPLDPRDGNNDGAINVLDVRYCQLRCTRASCAQ